MGLAAMTIAQFPRWAGHMDGWGWGWMWISGLLILVVLVALVVAVLRSTTGPSRQAPPDTTARAREILGERYARGEISTEAYHERLDALR